MTMTKRRGSASRPTWRPSRNCNRFSGAVGSRLRPRASSRCCCHRRRGPLPRIPGSSGSMFDHMEERPSSPFIAQAQQAAASDFPRLGLSPAPLDADFGYEYEYPVPSRAHNPLTLNTPFARRSQELIEQQLSLYNQQQQQHRYSQQLYYNHTTQQHSPLPALEFNLGFTASADDDDVVSLHAHSYPGHRATRNRSYSEPCPLQDVDC
eukprot:TRINITY_DN181_c1_g1_i2.p1 TRINITY_DN181_c1_g1~~TRINITY_DN181_c1_g1_i2.p1  ORF type:complete len:208 (-),score=10.28 TRINITY_DN181_c1_g1_i2:165-788(-)